MPDNIGHNSPGMAIVAEETASALSDWMKEHPVILTEEDARHAKLLYDRGSLCTQDLEQERKGKTKPLEDQVEAINLSYAPSKSLLKRVVQELGSRIKVFLDAEENRRRAIAEEAAMAAAEAEEEAREAERKEHEGISGASVGELDVDVAALTKAADETFERAKKLARQAAVAERETAVKIGGGFRRALSLRKTEEFSVTNACDAIADLGMNADIEAAIIKASKAYRKLTGMLPRGVGSKIERKV